MNHLMGMEGGKKEMILYRQVAKRFNTKYDVWDLLQSNLVGMNNSH